MNLYIRFFLLLLPLAGCSNVHTQEDDKDYFLDKYIAYVRDIQESKYPGTIEQHRTEGFVNFYKDTYGKIEPRHLSWDVQASFMKISTIKDSYFTRDDEDSCLTLSGKNHFDIPMVLDMRFVEESEGWRIEHFRAVVYESPVKPSYPTKASCPEKGAEQ